MSLLTFGSGRRDCVGQALAIKLKELYLLMAMMFMKYEVFGPDGNDQFDIKINNHVVMESVNEAITLKLR